MRSIISKFIDEWIDFIIDDDNYFHYSKSLTKQIKVLNFINTILSFGYSYMYIMFIGKTIVTHISGYDKTVFFKIGIWMFVLPLSIMLTYYTKLVSNKWKLEAHILLLTLPLTLLMIPITCKKLKERQITSIIKEIIES